MIVITTVIGVLMNHLSNHLSNTLTHSITNVFPMKNKSMNSYEKQIYETLVKGEDISDRLDTIGGLDDIKDDLKSNVLLPLKHPVVFFSKESSILRPSRGLLFYGPPGTGKTMLARAIAAEANVPFLSLSLSVLENKYYGESNKLIQAIFSLGRKIQPCIIFFDEIDGLMKQRSEFDQSSVYGFKTELLSQIDGMDSKENDSIFVIGTTNNITILDPAIKRRLPKVYEMKLPNESDRFKILQLKTKQEKLSDDLLNWICQRTDKYSGSDLSELIRRASAYRLQEQCEDEQFKRQLELATCVNDVFPLLNIKENHFRKALLAMGTQCEDIENSEEFDDEEEAPPE